MDGDELMTFGKVHKKKSTWWYSKQSDNSDLILSTKHRTQGDALKAASVDLKEGRINKLYVYHGTGSLKEIMSYDLSYSWETVK
jgi:hypothetical protein